MIGDNWQHYGKYISPLCLLCVFVLKLLKMQQLVFRAEKKRSPPLTLQVLGNVLDCPGDQASLERARLFST